MLFSGLDGGAPGDRRAQTRSAKRLKPGEVPRQVGAAAVLLRAQRSPVCAGSAGPSASSSPSLRLLARNIVPVLAPWPCHPLARAVAPWERSPSQGSGPGPRRSVVVPEIFGGGKAWPAGVEAVVGGS